MAAYLLACLLIAFVTTETLALLSPLTDVQFLCDVFTGKNGPPQYWSVNPCAWTTPCEEDINGVSCSNDRLIYLLFFCFVFLF